MAAAGQESCLLHLLGWRMPSQGKPDRGHWILAGLVFITALGAYIATLCPTVFVEGTGENIVSVYCLGVPHPPGFPLYCLLGKLFTLAVPVGDIAYRVNLFSAVLGAVASAGLFCLLSLFGVGAVPAVVATLTLSFSATFWREATIAEVYTLSLTIIIAQFALLVHWRNRLHTGERAPVTAAASSAPTPERQSAKRSKRKRTADVARAQLPTRQTGRLRSQYRPLLWWALLFGVGLTVHPNQAFLLPGWLYLIWSSDRSVFRRWRLVGSGVLLVIAGLCLHLYAPIRAAASPAINWGNPAFGNLWRYLTAEQYRGRMFSLPLRKVVGNLWGFVSGLPGEFAGGGHASWFALLAGALAVAGAIMLWRKHRQLAVVIGLMIVLPIIWAINYNIPWEIDVYYLPVYLALVIWIGWGAATLLTWLSRRRVLAVVGACAVLAVPALALGLNYSKNDLSRQRFMLDYGLDILGTVEPQSAILLPSTNPTFVLLYLTQVEQRAPGLQLYARTAAEEEGEEAQGERLMVVSPVKEAVYPPEEQESVPELRFLAEVQEPVFAVERTSQSSLPGYRQIAWGCLYRIVPEAEAASWLSRAPDSLWSDYRFRTDQQQLRYGAEQRLITRLQWLAQGDGAVQRGDLQLAARCYRRAERIADDLPETLADIGMRYADQGQPHLAIREYERALRLRPKDAEFRNRLGRMYIMLGKDEQAEQQFRRAIELEPELAIAHSNLGGVLAKQKRFRDAIDELELAVQYDPNLVLGWNNLGASYASVRDYRRAAEAWRKSLALSPNQPRVKAALAQVGAR